MHAGFERLSRLAKLETLDLGFNNFNNSILSSLKGLSSLKYLNLDYNKLPGSIDIKGTYTHTNTLPQSIEKDLKC